MNSDSIYPPLREAPRDKRLQFWLIEKDTRLPVLALWQHATGKWLLPDGATRTDDDFACWINI